VRSKRFIGKAAALTAGAAIAAIPFTTASAGAATAQPAQPATSQQQQTGPGAQEMKFYDDYWTLSECKSVGQWGLDNGKWTVYDCQESPVDYDLYYDS
jgi:hypothetical protein